MHYLHRKNQLNWIWMVQWFGHCCRKPQLPAPGREAQVARWKITIDYCLKPVVYGIPPVLYDIYMWFTYSALFINIYLTLLRLRYVLSTLSTKFLNCEMVSITPLFFRNIKQHDQLPKHGLNEVSPSRHSFNSVDPVLARSSRSDDLIWWICVSWGWRVFWELMAFQMRTKARWRVPGYQWAAGLCGNFKQWCGSLFSLRALHSLMTWGM